MLSRRMLALPIVGLIVGFLSVYFTQLTVPPFLGPYLSLAALAGVDAVCGGYRAGLEGKFADDIFLSGFAINTLIAAFLAYLGDRIGVDLFLAAVVLLGGRVFLNLSLIRRYYLTQRQLAARKEA
ncbi:MAG: small basic family protein [Capsulimonadales bacterium]|nr:small basic family protein [Capsulimonadales bacterium]